MLYVFHRNPLKGTAGVITASLDTFEFCAGLGILGRGKIRLVLADLTMCGRRRLRLGRLPYGA